MNILLKKHEKAFAHLRSAKPPAAYCAALPIHQKKCGPRGSAPKKILLPLLTSRKGAKEARKDRKGKKHHFAFFLCAPPWHEPAFSPLSFPCLLHTLSRIPRNPGNPFIL
jgi:hypothetical protein